MLLVAYCLRFPDGRLAGETSRGGLERCFYPTDTISLVRFWDNTEIEVVRNIIKDYPEHCFKLNAAYMDVKPLS